MRLKKRHKSGRFRGSKTHARGFKKKARGSGHQGGVGMAGTGKRGDQKKTLVLNLYGNDYFGKDKTLRRGNKAPKLKVINLQYLQDNIDSLVKKGKAKDSSGVYQLNLSGYKKISDTLVEKYDVNSDPAIFPTGIDRNYLSDPENYVLCSKDISNILNL